MMQTIYIIGVAQAFFLEFLLLNKKGKKKHDIILAVWMFLLGVHIFLYYLYAIEFHLTFPRVLLLLAPLPLLHGPMLILYVSSIISFKNHKRHWLLLNFIPPALYFLRSIPMYFWSGDEIISFIFIEVPTKMPITSIIIDKFIEVSWLIYIAWSLYLIYNHHKNIKNQLSFVEKVNLNWLRNIIIGMFFIWIAIIFTTPNNLITSKETQYNSDWVYFIFTIFVFLIGYYGVRQGVVFQDNQILNQNENVEKEKYLNSSLKEKDKKEKLSRLEKYMMEKKPYLSGKLTLAQLAKELDFQPHQLSQLINEMLEKNFYEFVNSYRIEDFKKRLEKDDLDNFTLLGHALESGFNSKSTFNDAFKKLTGQTPTQYIKSK